MASAGGLEASGTVEPTLRLTPTTRYWAGGVSLLQFNVARKKALTALRGTEL